MTTSLSFKLSLRVAGRLDRDGRLGSSTALPSYYRSFRKTITARLAHGLCMSGSRSPLTLSPSTVRHLGARSLTYVLGITRSQFSFFLKVACFFVLAVPGGQLAWAPKKRGRIQDSTIRFRALAACKQTPRALLMAQYPVAYQRALARKQMFAAWAREWVQTRPE